MKGSVLLQRVDTQINAKINWLPEATKRSKSFLATNAIWRYLRADAWQTKKFFSYELGNIERLVRNP
jgi:predicted transcriptional regulator